MISKLLTSLLVLFSNILSGHCHHPKEIPCGGIYNPKECFGKTWQNMDTVEDFARCAPAKLPTLVRDYIWSGSGREVTLRDNEDAYKKIRIRKRSFQNLWRRNLSTVALGKPIAFPIAISPTAGQSFAHPDGDIATARGAAVMETIMVLSSYSNIPIEKVAASAPPNARLWMQTYIFPDRADVLSIIQRAEKVGFEALVVTIDESADTVIRCHVNSRFLEQLSIPRGLPNLGHPDDSVVGHRLTYKDITWLKQNTKMKVVVKGVMTGEDGLAALRAGASAIFVSNHGGRQLDNAMATIDVLPEIVDTVRKWYPNVDIYVDGGIRNGWDVFKAIARGATVAFIGRPNIYGLTMGGEDGVKKVLTILRNEFEEAMYHAGFNTPKDITRSSVIPPRPDMCDQRPIFPQYPTGR